MPGEVADPPDLGGRAGAGKFRQNRRNELVKRGICGYTHNKSYREYGVALIDVRNGNTSFDVRLSPTWAEILVT